MQKQSKKKEIQELYKDALHYQLSREDISDYLKEVKVRRRMHLYDEL